jgi:methionine synthase II (cobalamin-independent)
MANPGMYRADHVGGLLRPAELASVPVDAPAAQREELAEAAIKRLVTLQRELGLSIVSDGELRRTDPMSPLHDAGEGRARVQDETRFLQSLLGPSAGTARVPFKVTLPAPSTVPARLAGSLRAALEALIADGVNYIQLQNTEYARCLAEPAAAAALDALLAADRAAHRGIGKAGGGASCALRRARRGGPCRIVRHGQRSLRRKAVLDDPRGPFRGRGRRRPQRRFRSAQARAEG